MVSSDFRKEAREKLTGKWGQAALITFAYLIFFLIFTAFIGLFSKNIQTAFSLLLIIVNVPLAFGLTISFVKLFTNDNVGPFDFFTDGFKNFGKSWKISALILLKLLIPLILLCISIAMLVGCAFFILADAASSYDSGRPYALIGTLGFVLFISSIIWLIIKSLSYQLSFIIAAEQTELSAKESIAKSEQLMNGKRSALFRLQLSFIGWFILLYLPYSLFQLLFAGSFLASIILDIGYIWLLPYIQFAIIAFYKSLNKDADTSINENNLEGNE